MSAPIDLSILAGVITEWDRNVCQHDETHRGGTIWTICDGCGMEWADDRGGFKPYEEPASIAAVRALLAAAPGCADPVVETNVALLRSRSALGVEKYGTTLADSKAPLRDWLEHALLEVLDCANYLQTAMHKIDAAPAPSTPAASVDTAEFRELVQNVRHGLHAQTWPPLIDHIEAHVAGERAHGYMDGFAAAQRVAAPQQHAQAALSDEQIRLAIALGEAQGTLRAIYTVSKEPFVTQKAVDAAEKINHALASHQPAAAQPPHNKHCGCPNCCETTAAAPVLNNPHTGLPRDPRDVASDPDAILCVAPGEPLKAARQGGELPQDERAALNAFIFAMDDTRNCLDTDDATLRQCAVKRLLEAEKIARATLAQRAASVPAQAVADEPPYAFVRYSLDYIANSGKLLADHDTAALIKRGWAGYKGGIWRAALAAPVPAASVLHADTLRRIHREGHDILNEGIGHTNYRTGDDK